MTTLPTGPVDTAQQPATVPAQHTARRGRRIALINNKGGVGKTTTTRELASALARQGRRVLAADIDPQGNLTTTLAAAEVDLSLADVLYRPTDGGARGAIVPCGWDIPDRHLIDVLPATLDLEARGEEAHLPGSHGRLHRVLAGVTDDYDYTLMDCRPALGHLEQMVVASLDGDEDGILIVVEPGRFAISGARRVITEVADWTDRLGIPMRILGIVINHYQQQLNLHTGRIEGITASLADVPGGPPRILEPYIPKRVRVAEVADLATPSTGDSRLDREGVLDKFDQLAKVIDS